MTGKRMSAYDRGTEQVRREIQEDRKRSGNKEITAALTKEGNRADLAEERLAKVIDENTVLVAQIAELTKQLAAQKAMNEDLDERLQNSRNDVLHWRQNYLDKDRAHLKLSAIVRAAISPETYREYREWCAVQFPSLFNQS